MNLISKILNVAKAPDVQAAAVVQESTGTAETPVAGGLAELQITKAPAPAKKLYQDVDLPAASETFQKKAIAALGRKLFDADAEAKIKELKALGDVHRALSQYRIDHGPAAARQAFNEHRQKLAENLAAGNYSDASICDSWTAEDWSEDHTIKAGAAAAQMAQVNSKAAPLAKIIADIVGDALEELAAKWENEERAEAEAWTVVYRPSTKLTTLGRLSWQIRQKVPIAGTASSRPDSILSAIGRLS